MLSVTCQGIDIIYQITYIMCFLLTQGQCWPLGIVVACVCLSITHFFLPTSRGPFHSKDTIAHHYKNHLTIAGNPIMAISLFYNQPAYPHKCISCAGKMPEKNFCVLHHVMVFESLAHLYIWTWSGDLQSCVCHHPVLTIYGLTCLYRQCL